MTTILLAGLALLAEPAPLLVGGHAHGADNIAALAELGLGNFVWIPKVGYSMGNTPWDAGHDVLADVDACVRAGLHFMVSQRRGLGEAVRPGGFEFGGDCSGDLHAPATIAEIRRRAGGLFAGLHAEELDADLVQSAIRPSFRSRLPELYAYTDRAGGRAAFEAELTRQRDAAHAAGAAYLPNLCVTHHACGFRTGADMVVAELLEHLPTTELQLAYLRGGARQFGRPWGAWVSPWYWGQVPCDDKATWPVPQAQPGGGHTAAELRRALCLAWVSGARLLTVQETEPLLSRVDGRWRLGPWGTVLKAFCDTVREHPGPLQPLVPLALVVDADNGWAPAHLWEDWNETESVWGKLSTDRSDAMLTGFLQALLPGFGRTREAVTARRDGYPGAFCATPLGPFDIVASDCAGHALRGYQAVALAGEVRWTPSLRTALADYVQGGGRVLLNALHLRDGERLVQDEALLGVRLKASIRAAERIRLAVPVPGLQSEYREPWFAFVEVERTTAEVLAADPDGRTILTRQRLGAGEVWLSTPEYLLAGYGDLRAPLRFGQELLGALAPAGMVTMSPAADLSWIAARQGAELVVAVANGAAEPRRATLTVAGQSEPLELPGGATVLLRRPAR
ncbi:MAG: hypothetical protein HYU66_27620 [Armatimonadetes bacterium]|nr:hypothetical protein [Armatimonadota bacterium]